MLWDTACTEFGFGVHGAKHPVCSVTSVPDLFFGISGVCDFRVGVAGGDLFPPEAGGTPAFRGPKLEFFGPTKIRFTAARGGNTVGHSQTPWANLKRNRV